MEILQKDILENGVFIKQLRVPSGNYVVGHKHKFDHTSILAKGTVVLKSDGEEQTLKAPYTINIKAGIQHEIYALEDAIWYCIHVTDVTDVDMIEDSIVEVA